MTLQLAHINDVAAHRPGTVAGVRRRTRVVLADDHPVVRLGVRRLIDGQPDMRVVADARMAEEALGYLEEGDDVVVVDYHLGGDGGLWVTRRLKRLPIPPRVLIYSALSDPALAVATRIAGADGFLTRDSLAVQLCPTIRRLAAGDQYLPPVPRPLAEVMRSRVLPEDRETFGMLLAGVPSAVIERRRGLTRDELEDRRGMILQGLAVAAQTGFPLDREQEADLHNARVLQL